MVSIKYLPYPRISVDGTLEMQDVFHAITDILG